MRHARKARGRGVLAEYASGSATQRAGMQRRSNVIVFMDRGTKYSGSQVRSAPRAPERHARRARVRGVLAEYAAGSGTQRAGMQGQPNAIVFMDWGTKGKPVRKGDACDA